MNNREETMKKILFISLVFMFLGCQRVKQRVKHYQSAVVGLDREVTLYAYDGSVIKSWSGKFNIETENGLCRFVKKDGGIVFISGTYIIEEK